MVKETIRTETDPVIGQIVEMEDNLETGSGLSRITEETISNITPGDMVDRIAEGNIEIIAIDITITIEVGIDQENGHFQVGIELEVQVIVDLGQDPEPVPIGIR